MGHPLYQQCRSWVNRPVTAHHVSGQSYYGVLQRVTPQGVYMRPTAQTIQADDTLLHVRTADQGGHAEMDAENVFFPFFIPFIVLAGLTLGFAAGAAASYPYRGYGYGYPY